jgi:hypothetical protein
MIESALLAPVSVQNRRVRLDWNGSTLSAEMSETGAVIFRNAGCFVERADGSVSNLFTAADLEVHTGHGALSFIASDGPLRMRLECHIAGGAIQLVMSLSNVGDEPISLEDAVYLQWEGSEDSPLLANPSDVFSLGAATGETGEIWAAAPGNKRVFALQLNDREPCYVTDNFLATRPVDAPHLVREATFSFEQIGEAACGFAIDLDAVSARVRVAMRGAILEPGKSRTLPRLTIDASRPAEEALDVAVDRIRAIYRPHVHAEVPSGWCSWYYFYERVTEDDILSNLRFLSENRRRFPWQVIQIDDGYQRHWGDWLQPGSKFPHDMAWLAREIKSHGFRPGIWVAPLIMTEPSQLYREHPDWALRRLDTGEPWTLKGWSPPEENPWIILDGTHPDYLAHLHEIFSVMAHDWGYDYFKIDATAFGAYAGLRYDSSLTGIQAVRKVMQTIRSAVGPDKFILGCGLPFGAAIGLVNGERVSDDISTAFRPEDGCCPLSVALPQTIHRSFIHGKWWHNDPDCVLVRADGTPHNPTLSEHGLGTDEARLMVTVAGLTQGIQMIGENLPALTEDRLAMLDMISPMMDGPARPLDLFSPKPTRLLTSTPHGEVLGLLNWSDEVQTLDLEEICDGRSFAVYEVWTDRFLGVVDRGTFQIEIPPHGARLLLLRPATDRPAFLGYDGHVSGGATLLKSEIWDPATGTLKFDFSANRAGRIGVRVPYGWMPDCSVLTEHGGEHWMVAVAKGENAHELRFKRRSR